MDTSELVEAIIGLMITIPIIAVEIYIAVRAILAFNRLERMEYRLEKMARKLKLYEFEEDEEFEE